MSGGASVAGAIRRDLQGRYELLQVGNNVLQIFVTRKQESVVLREIL